MIAAKLRRTLEFVKKAEPTWTGDDLRSAEARRLPRPQGTARRPPPDRRRPRAVRGSKAAASGAIRDMIRLVEVFGVHLLTLDLRQHGARHTEALDEVLRAAGVSPENYAQLTPDERFELLAKELDSTRPLIPAHLDYSPETTEVIRTFRTVAAILERQCPEAIDKYIISSTTNPAHLLEVLLPGPRGPPVPPPGRGQPARHRPPVRGARAACRPPRRSWSGSWPCPSIAGTWSFEGRLPGGHDRLLRQQQGERLAPVGLGPLPGARRPGRDRPASGDHHADVPRPRGRDRPGGRPREPGDPGPAPGDRRRPPADDRARRGDRRPLRPPRDRRAAPRTGRPRRPPHQLPRARGTSPNQLSGSAFLDKLAPAACRHYRGLVYDDPDFLEYFRQATPIEEIVQLKIGSRPSKRGKSTSLDQLRAIPWVFSWMQCRHTLPGWYGFGGALDEYLAAENPGDLATLQRDVPPVAVLADPDRQHPDDPGQGRHDHRQALRRPRRRPRPSPTASTARSSADYEKAVEVIRPDHRPGRTCWSRCRSSADRSTAGTPMSTPSASSSSCCSSGSGTGEGPHEETLTAVLESINGIASGLKNTG